ncbi:MAG: hypothetical protein WBC04_06880 [Candidatus Acidiferrales bacterium]
MGLSNGAMASVRGGLEHISFTLQSKKGSLAAADALFVSASA